MTVPIHCDERGGMFKPYDSLAWSGVSLAREWKQVLHNHTVKQNTVRGIYVQLAPFSEGKLVTCLRGSMFWVVVDLRAGSETFGQWDGSTLNGGDGRSLLIEPGLGHACLSISDDVELLLLADSNHSDEHGVGIRWDDPDIGIEWPIDVAPIISDAHAAYPFLKDFVSSHGGI